MENKNTLNMCTDNTVTVTVNGNSIRVLKGTVLSEIISGEKPCGGHGKCGKCKVVARGDLSELSESERKFLTVEELSRGVRLACITHAEGNCEVETADGKRSEQIVVSGDMPAFKLNPVFGKYGVAIDIGTTTLAARLYNSRGDLLSDAALLNPQEKWGADVISRIEAALDGKDECLAESIRQAISEIVIKLAEEAEIDTKEIDGVVVTGNTVMLSLLTGESVEPFSHAPFEAKRLFGETLTADRLQIECLTENVPVYLPYCISAFVGADVTCAILASEMCGRETAMLVDIGTNGEMALWHEGKLTVCSTAAGPAFEGVGISAGMRGAVGAIDKVTIENGALKAHVIGDVSPIGICGSGLIDAVSALLELEVIDETGYLEDDEYVISHDVTLTQNDVRMLQLSKSAICAGFLTLADSAGLDPEDIPVLYIAGGFGNYLNIISSVNIGFLPMAFAKSAKTIGNAAIAGAALMLLDVTSRERIQRQIKDAVTLELSTSKVFSDAYIAGMMFEEV